MTWDQSTTRSPSTRRGQRRVRALTVLTIACHPDSRRIGERALLPEIEAGHMARISRLEPDFAPHDSARGRPPDDPFLNRRPVLLSDHGPGGILLDPADSSIRIDVDGEPVTAPRVFPPKRSPPESSWSWRDGSSSSCTDCPRRPASQPAHRKGAGGR